MVDVWDYVITFPFGAWDGVYYTRTKPHHGFDIASDSGTPIPVSGTIIGLVGSTGLSTGPHLHVDKNNGRYVETTKKEAQNVRGTVVFAGPAGTAGNMVKIQADDGNVYRYLHLSKILVKTGQRIGDPDMISNKHKYLLRVVNSEVKGWNRHKVHSGEYDERELKAWSGKPVTTFVQQAWNEGKAYRQKKDKAFDALAKLPKLEKALNETQAKLHDAIKRLNNGSSQADLEDAISKVAKCEAELRKVQEDTITRQDWSSLWDKILSFFKKG